MKAFLAVTDRDWCSYLQVRPDLDEVNFWQPGGEQEFKALNLGEPFLFKLRYPENAIVDRGFFLTLFALAGELGAAGIGDKNGAVSFAAMPEPIERLHRTSVNGHEGYTIGCVILSDPFVFRPEDSMSAPRWQR